MTDHSFRTTFTVEQSPAEVFAAIIDVRAWWSGDIDGRTDAPGAEFTYRYEDVHYSRQRITELTPGRRVAWRVEEARLSFTADPAEWTGTEIIFDIVGTDRGTEVTFTHLGLVAAFECFDACSNAWGHYVGRLQRLIATGRSEPAEVA
jgi:uncharacterized protein YndB with AHSA1/START domain